MAREGKAGGLRARAGGYAWRRWQTWQRSSSAMAEKHVCHASVPRGREAERVVVVTTSWKRAMSANCWTTRAREKAAKRPGVMVGREAPAVAAPRGRVRRCQKGRSKYGC